MPLNANKSDLGGAASGKDNLFLWTIFLLFLAGLGFFCWLGSFYVFGHPEQPRAYRILTRLGKLPPPTRFLVTKAPPGEFLTAQRVFEQYSKFTKLQLERENELTFRSYLKNYAENKRLVPYLVGKFSILRSYELQESDLVASGVVALAQSEEYPQLLVELLYPTHPENVRDLLQLLQPGLEVHLEKTRDLSAILQVVHSGDGRMQATAVPLLYGSYAIKNGVGTFSLEPPGRLNVAAGFPIVRGEEVRSVMREQLELRRKRMIAKVPLTGDPATSQQLVRVDAEAAGGAFPPRAQPVAEGDNAGGTSPGIAVAFSGSASSGLASADATRTPASSAFPVSPQGAPAVPSKGVGLGGKLEGDRGDRGDRGEKRDGKGEKGLKSDGGKEISKAVDGGGKASNSGALAPTAQSAGASGGASEAVLSGLGGGILAGEKGAATGSPLAVSISPVSPTTGGKGDGQSVSARGASSTGESSTKASAMAGGARGGAAPASGGPGLEVVGGGVVAGSLSTAAVKNLKTATPTAGSKGASSAPGAGVQGGTVSSTASAPALSRAIPVAVPLAVPVETKSSAGADPKGPDAKPFVAAAPASNVNTAPGSWKTYRPGQQPPGRVVSADQALALAGRNDAGQLYLRGQFVVTASGNNRAVLRQARSDDRLPPTRVIVEYPAGSLPPQQGSSIARDEGRGFEIREVRRGADGQVNIFVRDVHAP
ncbi:MAG: hypothetical protein RLZZ244_1317 [Verrucomicrobiota bacterium]